MKAYNGIIGLAIGDTMGVPIEFIERQELQKAPVTEMLSYGTHNMPKGSWSDDTSMTLATIEAISKTGTINIKDIADNFIRWYRKAEFTSTGKVFDIGRTTIQALAKYELNIDKATMCGENTISSNGNGSLMRILPIAYYSYSKKLKDNEIMKIVSATSSITHRHEISIIGCYIYVKYAIEILKGNTILGAYRTIQQLDYSCYSSDNLSKYDRILKDDISNYSIDEIKSTGYIVDTLEAVIWVLLNTDTYNEVILKAINLGIDTDTIGACTGGLAGAYYGIDTIKEEWKKSLLRYDYIIDLCNKFDKAINKPSKGAKK